MNAKRLTLLVGVALPLGFSVVAAYWYLKANPVTMERAGEETATASRKQLTAAFHRQRLIEVLIAADNKVNEIDVTIPQPK